MRAVKAGPKLIELIRLAYSSDKPLLLEGVHGIAKSEILETAAKVMGIDCIISDLSLMEPTDLIGLPTHKKGRTVYSPPSFLPKSGKGLLVIEELNRADKYMLSPCLQLLTARRLNEYILPEGWLPVATINPSDDSYQVNQLDPALLSRFVRVSVVPDVQSWLKWAEANTVHQKVREFVGAEKNIFKSEESNPRAWKYVSDILCEYERMGDSSHELLNTMLAGTVGNILSTSFLQFYLSNDQPLSASEVLSRYTRVRSKVKKWAKSKQTDLLQGTAHALKVALQDSDVQNVIYRSKPKQKNIERLIEDLPGDLAKGLHHAAVQAGVL